MNLSRNKLLAIGGGAVAAVVVAVLVFSGAKRALDPTRTPMPDKSAPISAIEPQLDKLQRMDRQLVIGYLLLQRGEISSLPPPGIEFTAKTFREAIDAQKALLAAKQVYAEWPLMRALEGQALQPLREAVPIELAGRRQATMSQLVRSGAVVVASGGSPDEPRTVMIYRVRNAGRAAIKHLTGYVQPQLTSDDWARHTASSCRVELTNLAPGASAQVICAQIDLNAIGDASKTPDASLFIDWRPDMVEYADGTKLAYDMNAISNTLLWNRYTIDGDIKK